MLKKNRYILFSFLIGILWNSNVFASTTKPPDTTSLNGRVIDIKTGKPIFGAKIFFPDTKQGATTNFKGYYKILNLPKKRLEAHISAIGYKEVITTIDLSKVKEKTFKLKSKVVEQQFSEIVVTGTSKATERKKMPIPVTTLSAKALTESSSTNIIDAITKVPGVSQISTGPGISKPIIRGLGYNRVVVINHGVRQENQQWGGEHGVEVDRFGVDHVEVLKGPASLMYGSDALAGVINMLPSPPLHNGQIKGKVALNYQSNNGLLGGSVKIRGNQNGFVWGALYTNLRAHDYKNKYDGYVFNSRYKKNNIELNLGLNKTWGYSHIHFGAYRFTPGIAEGERDAKTGRFIKLVAQSSNPTEEIAEKGDFLSYQPENFVPYQHVNHYSAIWNSNFILKRGSLKTIFGWQLSQRKEYENILDPNQYGMFLNLNTFTYDIRYSLPSKNNWNITVGGNGMYQNSKNKGIEFLVPDDHLFSGGIFAVATKKIGRFNLKGGVRYDYRHEKGEELWLDPTGEEATSPTTPGIKQKFEEFTNKYNAFTGSIGATYQINDFLNTKLNLSKGFRAPNIAELSANGVHEGTAQYMIGNTALQPENSWEIDYTLGLSSRHISATLNLFYNHINHYIYYQALKSHLGGDSLTNNYRTFKYTAGKAQIYGGEISIDIHPHPLHWLHIANGFSYIYSTQLGVADSMKYLPMTPAPKWSFTIRAERKNIGSFLKNSYVKIGFHHYFKQNHFYSAFGTETATPAYTLFYAGIGTDFISRKGKTLFSLYISAKNLFNMAYQSHLSRLKYLGYNNKTGRRGIFNMGRNISFKIVVPIPIYDKYKQ